MARKTISLDGTWDVVFDDTESLKPDCFRKGRRKTHQVAVPGVWEQVRPFYDGVGFYRRTFDLPASALAGDRRLRLKFGAVNYFAEVFLNGRKLGQHEGGYTPFVFDITGAAQAKGNELVVRVIDPPRKRKIHGFRSGAPLSQSDIPTWKAGWYFNFGGIWQPVEIIVTDRMYVDDVFVQPQADMKTVKIQVTVLNRGKAGRYDIAVRMEPRKGDEKTGVNFHRKAQLKKGANTVTFTGEVARPHLWSPDDPFLYRATASVSAGGKELDRLAVECGMRFFTAEDGVFKLNGRRIALRGFLQQGVYPRHLVFPESRAAARRELMLLKKNGMNFIRAHLKPPPRWLDLADQVGILLLEEPPIGWIENTENTVGRCKTEIEELVRRDRNRPSVVMWGLLNEATHYRTFTPEQLKTFEDTLRKHCRSFDPTRIVIQNSGGDIGGQHGRGVGALMPFDNRPTQLLDSHTYCAVPVSAGALETYRSQAGGDRARPDGVNFVSRSKKRQKHLIGRGEPALFISEFGAFEHPPDFREVLARYTPAERRLGLEDYVQHRRYYESLKAEFRRAKLGKVFGSLDRYIRRAQLLGCENIRVIISAMRANPRNSGWVFTQLADASGEIFGATDIWRQPRLWFKDMAQVCVTPLVVPHVSSRIVAPGETVGLNLRLVNEDRTGDSVRWKLSVRDARGRSIRTETGSCRARGWVQEVLDTALDAPRRPGRYTVEAELRRGRKLLSENSVRFTVVEPPEVPVDRIGMFDMDNEIRPTLEALGIGQIDKGGNNYRHKNVPCVYLMRPSQSIGLLTEYNKQLRRIVELGGAALVLEPVTPMLYDELLPGLIRLKSPMRNLLYMRPSPVWDGLPTSGGFMDYEFADVLAGRTNARHNPDDVLALGGTSIAGGLCAHMWTGPEVYQWGSLIDLVPVGRGHLVFCQLQLVHKAGENPMAARLLANLIRYTASLVKRGGEKRLLSRCIDPLNVKD